MLVITGSFQSWNIRCKSEKLLALTFKNQMAFHAVKAVSRCQEKCLQYSYGQMQMFQLARKTSMESTAL